MQINWQLRELNLKIVYYGPALSGKTTNPEQIPARDDPIHRPPPPGQSPCGPSRKLVLRGADGVVFVADSSPEFMHANKVAWGDMNTHLASHGIALEKLPIVLQCNKQDLIYAVDPQPKTNF